VYLSTLFFEGIQQQKKSPKTPGNAFSALLKRNIQNFAAGAAKKKTLLGTVF